MSYTKTTWAKGDVITATKLNNMENGIANATPFIIEYVIEGSTITLQSTWQEIWDKVSNGSIPYILTVDNETHYLDICTNMTMEIEQEEYYVDIGGQSYTTDNANGYPSATLLG